MTLLLGFSCDCLELIDDTKQPILLDVKRAPKQVSVRACEHREHSASCSAELGGATDNSENPVNGGHVLGEEGAGLGDAADGA